MVVRKKIEKEIEAEKIIIYDPNGEIKDTIKISPESSKIKINYKLLAQTVRVYLNNQRKGTASTKTRGEVKGSTRKIYRQKGTGRARHGDIKAPIFVGGGVVGGPKPKEYRLKLNKKQIKKSLFDSFILKIKERKIIGLSQLFSEMKPKTRLLASFLKKMGLGRKILLVVDKIKNNNLVLAARNLVNLDIRTVDCLNAYNLLNADTILFMENPLKDFIKKINES